jgi:hypothetical protein
MTGNAVDETRITGRVANLDIDIRHRRLLDQDAEQISVTLVATPGFDAFAQLLGPANPLLAWTALNPFVAAWLRMWSPWFGLLGPPGKRG